MIRLKAPAFWSEKTPLSTALLPLSWLYRALHKLRTVLARPYRCALPVLCVGGAVVGGSGKTPTVLALTALLKQHGLARHPYILTRGYGGTLKGPVAVDPAVHGFQDVGDEALLLARAAPVIVSADRAAGAKLAQTMGADMIVMDDGMQNPGLCKDLVILVVDTHTGFGNERLFPAGPLRTPVREAMEQAGLILTVGKRVDPFQPFSINADSPALWAYMDTPAQPERDTSYFAFAGIGRPDKFKTTLEQKGFNLAGWKAFGDHHPYSARELNDLRAQAAARGARLITTEKDYVRLPAPFRESVDVLPVTLIFEEEEDLLAFLKRKLGKDT